MALQRTLVQTNTQWSTGPRGFKIKMTLESAEPKGRYMVVGRQMVKPRLGLVGGVLFKANCQGVPITPNRVRNAKSRNITPV